METYKKRTISTTYRNDVMPFEDVAQLVEILNTIYEAAIDARSTVISIVWRDFVILIAALHSCPLLRSALRIDGPEAEKGHLAFFWRGIEARPETSTLLTGPFVDSLDFNDKLLK